MRATWRPLPAWPYAAVCRIKATLDGWDEVSVRLPALDDALTVTLSAKVECSFYARRTATRDRKGQVHHITPEGRERMRQSGRKSGALRVAQREPAAR